MLKKITILFSSLVTIFILTMLFKAGKFSIPNNLIFKIRLNKYIILFLGSFSIGFSTWILQRFTKNKIVGSSFFGISSFNILVLVLIYTFAYKSLDINYIYKWILPFISIGASMFVSILLSLTIFNNPKYSKKNIVLIGIMLNYLFTAISYFYIQFLDPNMSSAILDISIGAINEGYSYIIVFILMTFQILTIIWYMAIYKAIRITNINDDLSKKHGNNIKLVKIQQIVIVGINVAISFSLLGSVSFLGIIAANIIAKLFRESRYNAILSGIFAIIVTSLSYLVMNGFINTYYPIGITSAIISVPYFIYKILRSKNA